MGRVLAVGVLGCLLGSGAACSTGSRERACNLVTGTGCSGRLQCMVDAEGTPICGVPNGDARGDGQACSAADQCAQGLGCVRVAGVARCARFCESVERPDPCVDVGPGNGSAAFPDYADAVRDDARCVGVLPDRPDLGVCVLPCRLGVLGDCPGGSTCGLPRGFPAPTCIPEGPVGELEPCGAVSGGCTVSLVCATIGGVSRVCLPPPTPEGTCEGGMTVQALGGVASEIDLSAPQICSPCLGLGVYGDDGAQFGRCTLTGRVVAPLLTEACATDEADLPVEPCPCGPFGLPAVLSDLPTRILRDVGRSAEALAGADTTPSQVAATRVGAGFAWADGTAVRDDDWATGQPGAGDCVGLTSAGLATQACDASAATLCRADP